MELYEISNVFISRNGKSLFTFTKDDEKKNQYAVSKIDLKYYHNHLSKKEAFLDIHLLDCSNGIDLLSGS